MLNHMRALSQNWKGRLILGSVLTVMIIAFAIFGIGDRFTNFNASELARIGDKRITVDQYRFAYQNQLTQLQEKERRGITNEEARAMGLDRQVLYRLLSDAVVDQEAAKLGLAVGNEAIARTIYNDEAFRGASGKFDRMRFASLLQDARMSEASYVAQQRGLILRNEVEDAVVGDLSVPKALVDEIRRYKAEVRDFDFFILPPSAAGALPTPTPDQLKSFYEAHVAKFQAPEYRKLVVLSVVPANLIKPDAVSDADVKKRYDDMKTERFVTPERRAIQQLVFANDASAEAAKAKLDKGESFDKLAADEKKSASDISLGTVKRSELEDPAVADAAFALPQGGTSGLVKGKFGKVIVHVSKILPKREQSLMEVSGQLKDEIAIIRANQEARHIRDTIEDQRTGGKTLTEAAATVGQKVRVIDAIDAQGRDKAHHPVEGLVDGPRLLKAAFSTDVGADTEMLTTSNNGYVWYEVAGITPAHQLPQNEVTAEVEAGWKAQETGKRLADMADKLVEAMRAGKPIAEVAAGVAAGAAKVDVMRAVNMSREGSPQLPAIAVGTAFQTPVGGAGSTALPGRGRIVFKVTAARVPPADPNDKEFAKLMDDVKSGLSNDLLAQYLQMVQREVGVTINQNALRTALGEDAGS